MRAIAVAIGKPAGDTEGGEDGLKRVVNVSVQPETYQREGGRPSLVACQRRCSHPLQPGLKGSMVLAEGISFRFHKTTQGRSGRYPKRPFFKAVGALAVSYDGFSVIG